MDWVGNDVTEMGNYRLCENLPKNRFSCAHYISIWIISHLKYIPIHKVNQAQALGGVWILSMCGPREYGAHCLRKKQVLTDNTGPRLDKEEIHSHAFW